MPFEYSAKKLTSPTWPPRGDTDPPDIERDLITNLT